MKSKLADVARKYSPAQDGGVLRFRHPWVLGSDNKGKWIRIGISKLSPSQQGQLLEDAQSLLQKPPLLKTDAPKVDQLLLTPYFKAIKSASRPEYQLDLSRWPSPVVENVETGQRVKTELLGSIPDEYYVESGLPPPNIDPDQWFAVMKFIQNLRDHVSRLDGLLAAERREVERLNNVIERQNRLSGEKGESEKKTTVRECLEQFEKNFRLKEGVSESQRDDVMRRVKAVLEKLGMDSRYCSINENELIRAVTATNPKSSRERARRIQAIKRFCTWLCRSKEHGGLGFVGNPAAELRPESDKKIQSKRRAEGLVSTLDPVPLMSVLPIYWRAFVAVIGYAGLRRGEVAALTWDAVDFTTGVIHVRANKFYPQLKSEASERPVPPFPDLWPILTEYKKTATHPELVFPRLNWQNWTNPCWLVPYKGRVKAYDLTTELSDALKLAKIVEKEPSRRLRRYWETRMRSEGYGQFVAQQHAGHSDEVGKSHYSDWQAIAKDLSAKMRVEEEKKEAEVKGVASKKGSGAKGKKSKTEAKSK